jgi:hypothetical protein
MICQKASRTEGNLCNLVARFPDESGESVKISTTSSNDPIGGDRHSRVTYIWCRKLEGEKRLDRTWLISNIRYSKFTLYGERACRSKDGIRPGIWWRSGEAGSILVLKKPQFGVQHSKV